MPIEKQFLTVQEFQTITGLSIPTIARHIRDGSLPSQKICGRRLVHRSIVDAYEVQAQAAAAAMLARAGA